MCYGIVPAVVVVKWQIHLTSALVKAGDKPLSVRTGIR